MALQKKVKKNTRTRSEDYLINSKYLGEEPSFFVGEEISNDKYMKSLNWYNYMCDTNDAREYLSDYLRQQNRFKDLENLKNVPDTFINTTSAWAVRMMSNGYRLPGNAEAFVNKKLQEMFNHAKFTHPNVIRHSAQDKIKEKANEIIGEIDYLIDQQEDFSLIQYLEDKKIPMVYCNHIISYYSALGKEMLELLSSDDEQLKEGYRHLSQEKIEDQILFLSEIVEDAKNYSTGKKNNKAPRKPRKKRPVNVDKLFASFKFQKECKDLQISSLDPKKILGAQEVWLYNTRYKILTVIRAKDDQGLSVKGTSIINYDELSSTGKSGGRKAAEYINRVLHGTKVQRRKIFDEIKTDVRFTNRTAENTIILKIL